MSSRPHIAEARAMGYAVTIVATSAGLVAGISVGGGTIEGEPAATDEAALDALEARLADRSDKGEAAQAALARGDVETFYALMGEIGDASRARLESD